jgi:epoxyqueuosine reductase QueG
MKIVRMLEDLDIGCVPIPSDDPYEHWEPERMYGRAILSLRHAGYLAGLGVLGKNTLLINEKYGNMIQLGAVLVNVDLKGDSLAKYEVCITDCQICLDSCPQGALDGIVMFAVRYVHIVEVYVENYYYLFKTNLLYCLTYH